MKNPFPFLSFRKKVSTGAAVVAEAIEIIAPKEAAVPSRRKRNKVAAQFRNGGGGGYGAAVIDRLSSDFLPTHLSSDAGLRVSLKTMRGRSRRACQNEGYAKAFVRTFRRNICGEWGFNFRNLSKDSNGKLDLTGNAIVKAKFLLWGKMKNCSVTKRQTWQDVQRIAVESFAETGEIFIRLIKGFNNPFGFAVQLIEADHVDETLDGELPNGNRIVMGVEINQWREPVAYYVLKAHPGDGFATNYYGKKHERIPAAEIIHVFLQQRPEQTRGIPPLFIALLRLNQLGAYEEAELIAARLGAAKGGFYTSNTNEPVDPDDIEDGDLVHEVTPGQFEQLPPGVGFTPYNNDHPNANYGGFVKAALRGIASALGVSYNGLANDLENVNFSSIRAGTIEEREEWKLIQRFFIQHLCEPVFEPWLEISMAGGVVPLPLVKFDKFNAPDFRGRRWAWIDPEKDLKAAAISVLMGWKTNSDVIEDQDGDPEEIWLKLEEEKKRMLAAGIKQMFPGIIAETDPAADPNGTGGDTSEMEEIRQLMDTYGIGVRSGTVTPQQEDEIYFRGRAGLPAVSKPIKDAWTTDGNVRRPITLQSQKGFEDAQATTGGAPKKETSPGSQAED